MKKILILLVLISVSLGVYQYVQGQKSAEVEDNLISRFLPEKEVEVFQLGKDSPKMQIITTGSIKSGKTAQISPQINGQITKIKVKVGDKVKKNGTLITLGDSLGTKIIDLQEESASKSAFLSENSSKTLADESGQIAVNSAQFGTVTSYQAYKNSLTTKKNTIESFTLQVENAEIELNNAKTAEEKAQNDIENAEEAYHDAKKVLSDARELEDETLIAAAKNAKKQAEMAIEGAELAAEIAQNRVKQAFLAIEQLETSQNAQLDQLNFAVQLAYNQYISAQQQIDNTVIRAGQAQDQATAGAIQTELNKNIAQANKDQKVISSPFDGVVTKIYAEEGNLTGPGQVLITVEQSSTLIAKTSVTWEESKYLSVEDHSTIETEAGIATGKIKSISPSLNPLTKKIDIEIEIIDGNIPISGQMAKIGFTPRTNGRIFVPINTISIENGKKYLKIASPKNTVEEREVSTGETLGNFIEITQGLYGNEKIITTVETFLEEGDKIKLASNNEK